MKKILSLFILFLIGLSFLSTPKTAAAACTKHPPVIDVVPQNRNKNGAPGDERQYTIKVTNKDAGTSCDPVKFVLSKEQLPGDNWTGKFGDNSLVIAKQKTKSTTFKLKSSTTATVGKKPITLGVKPESRPKKEFKIYYTVESSPTPTPTPTVCRQITPELTVTQDKTFVRPGGKITYTVKVKNVDQGPCPERNMNLTRDLRNENWIGDWDPNRTIVDFKKGQTRTKKLAVTSPNQAPVGTYKVKINLRNNSDQVVLTKEVNFVIRNN